MIGIDTVRISRIRKAIASQAFVERTYTDNEIFYCGSRADPAESFAGLFCAKEAAIKAIKQGFGRIMPREIEVMHDDRGAPLLVFHGCAAEAFADRKVDVSISHDGDTAVAAVEVL